MPGGEGFISGLLGGLAGGYADASWAQHQEQVRQDLADRQLQIEFIKEAMNSPNFRPEFLPIAFQHMQQILDAKPGAKGNKGKRGAALQDFSKAMVPQVSPERMKEIDPTGRRSRTAMQESEAPGQFPKGFTPIPGVDSMFMSPEEAGAEQMRRKLPEMNWRADEQRTREQAIYNRQIAVQDQIAARQKAKEILHSDLRASLKLREAANLYKASDPEMTQQQAEAQASEDLLQLQSDKHKDYENRARNIESQIQTRKANVQRANSLADSLIQHRKFIEQVTPLKAAIATADRDVTSSEARVRMLQAQRAGLLKAATGATPEQQKNIAGQIDDLDTQIDAAYQAHQNALTSVQSSMDQMDELSKRQTAMPPVPTANTITRDQYNQMVKDLGQERADAAIKRRHITVQ